MPEVVALSANILIPKKNTETTYRVILIKFSIFINLLLVKIQVIYSKSQNYRQSHPRQRYSQKRCPVATCEAPHFRPSACALSCGRRYTCSRQISQRTPRRYAFFRSSQPATSLLHRAVFCPFFLSPCSILYHFLLQLSRVTFILKLTMVCHKNLFRQEKYNDIP